MVEDASGEWECHVQRGNISYFLKILFRGSEWVVESLGQTAKVMDRLVQARTGQRTYRM